MTDLFQKVFCDGRHFEVLTASEDDFAQFLEKVARGEGIDTRDSFGDLNLFSAISTLAFTERADQAIALLDATISAGFDLNMRGHNDFTLLMHCHRSSDTVFVQYLLEKGVEIDSVNTEGLTALDLIRKNLRQNLNSTDPRTDMMDVHAARDRALSALLEAEPQRRLMEKEQIRQNHKRAIASIMHLSPEHLSRPVARLKIPRL